MENLNYKADNSEDLKVNNESNNSLEILNNPSTEIIDTNNNFELRRKRKKIICITLIIVVFVIPCVIFGGIKIYEYIQNEKQYNYALEFFENKDYDKAIEEFEKLGNYRDSDTKILDCKYEKAEIFLNNKDYVSAYKIYMTLGEYRDSSIKKNECNYRQAEKFFNEKNYTDSFNIYTALGDYEDSKDKAINCRYTEANQKFADKDYNKAYELYQSIQESKDVSAELEKTRLYIKYEYAKFEGTDLKEVDTVPEMWGLEPIEYYQRILNIEESFKGYYTTRWYNSEDDSNLDFNTNTFNGKKYILLDVRYWTGDGGGCIFKIKTSDSTEFEFNAQHETVSDEDVLIFEISDLTNNKIYTYRNIDKATYEEYKAREPQYTLSQVYSFAKEEINKRYQKTISDRISIKDKFALIMAGVPVYNMITFSDEYEVSMDYNYTNKTYILKFNIQIYNETENATMTIKDTGNGLKVVEIA